MAKKNSRDLFRQMNSNVSILEVADKSPILSTGNKSDGIPENDVSAGGKGTADKPDKNMAPEDKIKNTPVRKTGEITGKKMVQKETDKNPSENDRERNDEKNKASGGTDPAGKKDNHLVRITYNLTNDLNERFNNFTKQYELYKTSLIKALMEGWLDGSMELDENEVLFIDGLIKIKKKAGSRKAAGSILVPAELDTAFTQKCREAGIDKNSCIFRLLKKYLEQKTPES